MKTGYYKKFLALTLSATMVMGNIGTDSSVIVMAQDEPSVKKFSFGTTEMSGYTKVTKDQLYSQENGYGFSTKEFKEEAPGWVSGVYHERQATVTTGDNSYITDHEDYMEV